MEWHRIEISEETKAPVGKMEERIARNREQKQKEKEEGLLKEPEKKVCGSNETQLLEILCKIEPADKGYMEKAWERWDSLCKPLRSFGKLEAAVARTAGIQRSLRPCIDRPAVIIMGADNGVIEEGVSQSGSEVTAQVMENMGAGISAVCILAEEIHAEVYPVNIGMLSEGRHEKIINVPVKRGTSNIAKGPAMTREEAALAILTGIRMVEKLLRKGKNLIITGEMGIGNTTTSSAMAAVFLNASPEAVTGRGAGLSTEGLARKCRVIQEAIAVNHPDPDDVLDVLSCVGGLDIAGMAGCFIGGALYHVPVLVDGFISSLAAYCAVRLNPDCRDYMFATHCSSEPAGEQMLQAAGLEPFLYADMHMGEGTGAAAAYPVLQAGFSVYRMLPSFAGGKVEQYKPLK